MRFASSRPLSLRLALSLSLEVPAIHSFQLHPILTEGQLRRILLRRRSPQLPIRRAVFPEKCFRLKDLIHKYRRKHFIFVGGHCNYKSLCLVGMGKNEGWIR